jgi:hypothetical protein
MGTWVWLIFFVMGCYEVCYRVTSISEEKIASNSGKISTKLHDVGFQKQQLPPSKFRGFRKNVSLINLEAVQSRSFLKLCCTS